MAFKHIDMGAAFMNEQVTDRLKVNAAGLGAAGYDGGMMHRDRFGA